MPSRTKHNQWASRNIGFYNYCKADSDYSQDWSVVALFYSAMHKMQELLHLVDADPDSHETRKKAIIRFFPGLWEEYSWLYKSSKQVRYSCVLFKDTKVDDLKNKYYDPLVAKIESEITARSTSETTS